MRFGRVISLHRFGATVRLEDGRLAVVAPAEVEAHRPSYERSLAERRRLPLDIRDRGRGLCASLAPDAFEEPARVLPSAAAPSLTDEAFEERLAEYLRATEDWAPPDQPAPFERHLTRKQRRAAQRKVSR
jgi:hypothetical protein